MDVLGVVQALDRVPGLYGVAPGPRPLPKVALAGAALTGGLALAAGPALAAPAGWWAWRRWQRGRRPAMERLAPAEDLRFAPFGASTPDFADPLFHGLFSSQQQLDALLGDGALRIVERAAAPVEGLGLFVGHPGRPGAWIRPEELHEALEAAKIAEWIAIFEALGASRVSVTEGGGGEARGRSPAVWGLRLGGQARRGGERSQEHRFAPGPLDLERALAPRRWPHPQVEAIAAARLRGRQTSFVEDLRWEGGFDLDLSGLGRALGGPGLTARRALRLEVDFHPLPANAVA